ncbi:MAG: type II toxin-antitoxin system VapC family toxin [Paludibacteraceae bacterium]|nr:type II toxin-antitoxin system VapC family toxin [Paludibacteraceae bacterium]
MRYLLDTNVFIDIISDDYISKDVQAIIDDSDNVFYLSSESIKEFVHLLQNGKITIPEQYRKQRFDLFPFIEETLGIVVKYVAKEHLSTYWSMPVVEDHNDPSDRLIIAQAITERMPVISSDTKFRKYRKLYPMFELVLNTKK